MAKEVNKEKTVEKKPAKSAENKAKKVTKTDKIENKNFF